MNATALQSVVGVDISKNVFELAVADGQWRVRERARSLAISSNAGLPIVRSVWW
jgi:hypothetical protein